MTFVNLQCKMLVKKTRKLDSNEEDDHLNADLPVAVREAILWLTYENKNFSELFVFFYKTNFGLYGQPLNVGKYVLGPTNIEHYTHLYLFN